MELLGGGRSEYPIVPRDRCDSPENVHAHWKGCIYENHYRRRHGPAIKIGNLCASFLLMVLSYYRRWL